MGIAPDAVVVGSGAGGAAVVWRLTAAGLRVLLLEAGPRFDPARDYPLDAPGWERRGFPAPPGSRAEILYGDLGDCDPSDAGLASFDAAHAPRPPTRRVASGSGYAHVLGYGGSTLAYTGEAHRLHPAAFRLRSLTGQGADWPLGYADLEPLYAEAEALIGVAGPSGTGARWRSGPYPMPAHPQSPAARHLGRAAGGLGWDWSDNPRAALSVARDGRPACNYCGQCGRGCPLGDKGSADVTFLAAAEATGLLTVATGAVVTALIVGPGGRISSVDVVRGGVAERIGTPLLFLCAGAVQTPRLLLASASRQAPGGVANGSGQVGRNFMETLAITLSGLAPGLRLSQRGLPADAVSWQFNAGAAVPGVVGGFRLTSATQEAGLNGPVAHGTRLLTGYGTALKAAMRDTFGSALAVAAVGEVIPDERSRITLSPHRRDTQGVPLPVIHSVLTANSLTLLHAMASAARRLLAAAGVGDVVEQYGSWDTFTATHVFGTCRMGHDAATSVTDAWGRAHDHANLYIADASLFPSSGAGESPSLTIAALALRAADRALT